MTIRTSLENSFVSFEDWRVPRWKIFVGDFDSDTEQYFVKFVQKGIEKLRNFPLRLLIKPP